MVDNFDDDLFAHTKMTFGEHLEELRQSVQGRARADDRLSVWSAVCQRRGPDDRGALKRALEGYYKTSAVDTVVQKLKEREEKGEKIPEALKYRANIEELVLKQNLLFEEHFINIDEVLGELKLQDPAAFAGVDSTAKSAEGPGKPAGEKESDDKDAADKDAAASPSATTTPSAPG